MSTDLAILRRAFRQIRLSAVAWAIVFGGLVASSALTYVSTFPDAASRRQIAETTGRDKGVAILLGPIASIDSVGGYTVYKSFVTVTTIGAIWALLAATKLLRGEEDSGRWQLSLAGSTTASRATLATLGGLGLAVGVVFAGTTLFTALAGHDPDVGFSVGDSVMYGLSITIAPAAFLAVGALTSQLGRTRRVATGLGMAVFGIAFVVRMMADSGHATKWLLWATPFGWAERMRPITENNIGPLVLAVVVVASLVTAASLLASKRDAGAGVLAERETTSLRSFGLSSPLLFGLRLELPVLAGWLAGVAGAALSFGIVARVATGSVPKSMSDLLDKFGVQGTFLRQYLGVAFVLLAAVIALLPASQIGASVDEETSGRLAQVLAQPARRVRLFAGTVVIGTAAVIVAGVLAGLFTWFGAALQGVDPGFGRMLIAGCNLVPTALVVFGIGAVVRSLAPRAATAAVYGVVIWSYVANLLGSLVDGTRWLQNASVFHYMALAPAESIDATSVVVTLLVAALLLASATLLFVRRDIRSA